MSLSVGAVIHLHTCFVALMQLLIPLKNFSHDNNSRGMLQLLLIIADVSSTYFYLIVPGSNYKLIF